MSTLNVNPVCLMLNAAVQTITKRVWPQGYDESPNAPETFKALKEEYRQRGKITVFNGASERTIFDDAGINVQFRAWHDWCHLMGNHGFSLEGETAACEMQCDHVQRFYGPGDTADEICMWIRAEVIGQSRHWKRYGAFVGNQRAFAMEYVQNPEHALSFNWQDT